MKGPVLIVDDEESVLFAVQDYLGQLGYRVDCALDLETAISLLGQTEYPVVIADLRLGGSDNEEGLEIVKCAKRVCPRSRVVLLTAFGSPSVIERAGRLGATAVLCKPVPLQALVPFLNSFQPSRDGAASDRAPRS